MPQKPHRHAVEGVLLHQLLECYAQHLTKELAEDFRPRRKLIELVDKWVKENETNPRIISKTVGGQLRIEEILLSFAKARAHIKMPQPKPMRANYANKRGKFIGGSEFRLCDPISKLCGRADLITTGEITEFKSGECESWHSEQLEYYGALFLAQTGSLPSALRLVYTETNVVQLVPLPDSAGFAILLERMRKLAKEADDQIKERQLPAKPEPAKCAFCHVRGMCNDYWLLQREKQTTKILNFDPSITDYVPGQSAEINLAAFGIYIRDIWAGIPCAIHLPKEAAEKIGDDLQKIRVLSLRFHGSAPEVKLSLTVNSEIYVI